MNNFSLAHWLIFGFIAYFFWRFWRGKHRPVQSASPPNHENDAWEGAFWDVAAPRSVDLTIHLLYKDGADRRTKRTVNVSGFDPDADGIIIGHCMLRNATRTFRYDRIERAIDPASGEVITDVHAWLQEKYIATPRGVAETLADKHIDLFKVMLYVAKADGSMRAAEVQVIADLVAELTGDAQINAAVVKTVMSQLDTPTFHGFKLAFGRLIRQEHTIAIKAMDAAKNIVSTQKIVHAAEKEAIEYLEKTATRLALRAPRHRAPAC